MMRLSAVPIWGVLLAGLWVCPGSASAAKISAGHDPATDFSSFQTFAWREGKPAEIPKIQHWIVEAVERELLARGLTPAENNADLYVISFALVDEHTLDELSDLATWEFWTGVQSIRAADVGAGTLVLDLVDGRTEQAVWRGLITGAVSGKPDKFQKKIDKLVRRMFEKMPGSRP